MAAAQLMEAIDLKDVERLRRLLNNASSQFKSEVRKNAKILRSAIFHNRADLVRELIVNGGARVNTRDGNGETGLFAAQTPAMVNLLFVLDPETNINAYDNHKRTFAMVAADHGYIEILQELLDRGANFDGNREMVYAFQHNRIKVIHELVVNRGIDPWEAHIKLKKWFSPQYSVLILPYFQLLTLAIPRSVRRVGERVGIRQLPTDLLRKLRSFLVVR